ncbi:MAG: LysR family transcriptional regulator [Lachnospiraceae bacterium]|nr:LysR family transcriptional regulator [Lachnospiraceae bacterium]
MDIDASDRYIPVIASEGTISAAARKLGVSQPAMSLALSQLEKKLGVQIFDRQSVPLQLTAEGRIYLHYLNLQKQLIDDCNRELAELNSDNVFDFSLGAPAIYAETMLLRSVISYRKLRSQDHIHIKTAHLTRLAESVINGTLDAFISTSNELPPQIKSIYIKDEHLFFCRRSVPGKNNKSALPDKDSEMIFMEDDQPLQKIINKYLKENGIPYKNHISVNQVSSALRLMEAGQGTAIISEDALGILKSKKNIVITPLPAALSSRKIYFAYNGERFMSEPLKIISGLLIKENLKK